MPTYVYKCDSCGHEFEIHQAFTDDPLTKCPKCDMMLHRVIFPVPTHYKCAGFSITDKRGLTGHKRKPNIKVRMATPEELNGQRGT